MNDEELHAIISPYEIMVVNQGGVMRQVRCPFRVLCIEPVGRIRHNHFCYVYKVTYSGDNKICYHIGAYSYAHTHFRIS